MDATTNLSLGCAQGFDLPLFSLYRLAASSLPRLRRSFSLVRAPANQLFASGGSARLPALDVKSTRNKAVRNSAIRTLLGSWAKSSCSSSCSSRWSRSWTHFVPFPSCSGYWAAALSIKRYAPSWANERGRDTREARKNIFGACPWVVLDNKLDKLNFFPRAARSPIQFGTGGG